MDSTSGIGLGANVPTITSAYKAVALVNQAFSYQITATNSPTTYAATNLPGGLSINTSSGLISGTVTSPSDNQTIVISATNATGTGSKQIDIYVVADSVANTYPPVAVPGVEAFSKCSTIDANGNRYITGFFQFGKDLNPGVGIDAKGTDSLGGNSNAFVIKFNSTGGYLWSQTFACDQESRGRAVAVSPDGTKVYVTGYVSGRFAGVGTVGSTGLISSNDAFVMALNSSDGSAVSGFGYGGFQLVGGSGDDQGNALVVSPDNARVYLGLLSSSNDIGVGSLTNDFPNIGGYECFVAALDASSGAPVAGFGTHGIQRIAGNGNDLLQDIALSPDGATLYAAGQFNSSNMGIGTAGTLATSGGYDAFIAALNTSNGSAKTTFNSTGLIRFGGSNNDELINGLAATNSNIYATGYFRSTGAKLNGTGMAFNSPFNSQDAFVLALNTDGTPLNSFGVAGSGIAVLSGASDESGQSIAISGGSLYVTGYFSSFDTQFNQAGIRIPSFGGTDTFIMKMSATTSALDATFASTLGFPGLLRVGGGGDDRGFSVSVFGSNVYVAGQIGSTDFGIGGRGSLSTQGSNGFATVNYSGYLLPVDTNSGLPAFPIITSPLILKGIQSVAFSSPIIATGSPTSYALVSGTLPTGYTLNTSTGVISGHDDFNWNIQQHRHQRNECLRQHAENIPDLRHGRGLGRTVIPAGDPRLVRRSTQSSAGDGCRRQSLPLRKFLDDPRFQSKSGWRFQIQHWKQ